MESAAGDLENHLVRGVFKAAGVAVENFESQFMVDWNQGFWVASNFTEKKQVAPVPANARLLVHAGDTALRTCVECSSPRTTAISSTGW